MMEGGKFMGIFDIPTWIEIPLSIGITFVTYTIGFLMFAFAVFLLCLSFFLLGDRPSQA